MRDASSSYFPLLVLLSGSACSLTVLEQKDCSDDTECVDLLGPGGVCSNNGYCVAREVEDGTGVLRNGVSTTTVRAIGISAQTGTTRDLGIGMRVGIQAALSSISPDDVGYDLQYFARDDGYVPTNSVSIIEEISADGPAREDPTPAGGAEEVVGREAFAVVGSMGSPTSKAMLDTINDRQILFFGTYSGASHLYNDPPDRVVWQYRPRYEDEAYQLTTWLTTTRDPHRVPVTNVFALSQSPVMGTACATCVSDTEGTAGQASEAAELDQNVMDAYGFSGYLGIRRALQEQGVSQVDIPLATYRANSTNLDVAVQYFAQWCAGIAQGSHAPQLDSEGDLEIGVVMIPVALPGAAFIEGIIDVVDAYQAGDKPTVLTDEEWASVDVEWKSALADLNLVITSISPAGDVLSNTLTAKDPERLCKDQEIIVSQVVPFPNGGSSAAIRYREELESFDSNEVPGFVSFEGWAVGNIWAEAIRRTADRGDITTDNVISTFESDFDDVDLDIGTTIDYGEGDHRGSNQIFASRLDDGCIYQDFQLE